MTDLYLVRHAKAEPAVPDSERPLSRTGRRQADNLARWLGDIGVEVDRIEHSPLVRARETAERLAGVLQRDLREREDLRPGSDIGRLVRRLRDEVGSGVLLVGHNPGIERLAHLLTVDTQTDHPSLIFHTASVARLVPLEGSRYACDWLVRPNLLQG
ncbi:MAG TPA: phosphohistidine phosphatase SixA [Chloroflexota bacterium]|nr:phosphohistidine phosphatase SixA [Chloroflexota bacterium]